MAKCSFSIIKMSDWFLRSGFRKSGLRSTITDLGDGTVMHCWVPKSRNESNPNLVLVHGFGVSAQWQYCEVVSQLAASFNLYVPDLVFFGDSYSTRPERTESFQAECVMRVLEANSVTKTSVVGLSYGGFVAYSMAARYGEKVDRVVICCAGVCVEEKDLKEGMFKVSDLEAGAEILLPQTVEKFRELLGFVLYNPPKYLPSCFAHDFIDEMCRDYVEERRDLLRAVLKDRKISEIPKITQPTLIIWGDQDHVFPVQLAYRLKRHVGDNAELIVIKNAGHCFNVERARDFIKHLKGFLLQKPQASRGASST